MKKSVETDYGLRLHQAVTGRIALHSIQKILTDALITQSGEKIKRIVAKALKEMTK